MSVSMTQVHGAEAAIELLEQHPLPNYYLYHALLADAEQKAGHRDRATASYARAIELTMNERERDLLTGKLKELS
jgi:predicted RNA polymerase sigma factor